MRSARRGAKQAPASKARSRRRSYIRPVITRRPAVVEVDPPTPPGPRSRPEPRPGASREVGLNNQDEDHGRETSLVPEMLVLSESGPDRDSDRESGKDSELESPKTRRTRQRSQALDRRRRRAFALRKRREQLRKFLAGKDPGPGFIPPSRRATRSRGNSSRGPAIKNRHRPLYPGSLQQQRLRHQEVHGQPGNTVAKDNDGAPRRRQSVATSNLGSVARQQRGPSREGSIPIPSAAPRGPLLSSWVEPPMPPVRTPPASMPLQMGQGKDHGQRKDHGQGKDHGQRQGRSPDEQQSSSYSVPAKVSIDADPNPTLASDPSAWPWMQLQPKSRS